MREWKPEDEKAREWEKAREGRNTCPVCGSTDVEVRNYDPVWRDGEVFCHKGHYVRSYDAD